ncbi:MAG: NADPH:quinone oxidoreductase family protein [Betaproteobacteria bacterium]
MKAILCTEYAESPHLVFGDLPALKPGPREIVVEVHAAAASFMDVLMTQGRYQMKPPLPYVPGTDAAGFVSAVGSEVSRFSVGDRVACGNWHGAWAEQMIAREEAVTKLPEQVDFATAAAFRYAYGTARYALVTLAHLQPGEVLFISGAAGGVGLAAVDLGRHLGARVIAGVSTREKAVTARAHGAHEVVVYGEEDLRERIRALTGGQGVDVCLDHVGGKVFDTMARLMNWGGRLLPIGFASGEVPCLPANLPLLKNYSVLGAFWGAWAQRFPHQSAAADEALVRMVAGGELRPLISRVLPWGDFTQAMEAISSRQAQGRVVLQVR